MLRCLALLSALALPCVTLAGDGLAPEAAAKCLAWMKERPSSAPAEVRTVAPDTLCADFTSSLTTESRDAFLAQMATIPTDVTPQVIVRSLGGDVALGMDIGDAMLDRKASVHAYQLCISSCANYLFLAGRPRHVMADSVVLFHGGLVPRLRTLPNITAEGRDRLQASIDRQDAFLRRAAVDPRLFEWMDRFNLPDSGMARHCPTGRTINLLTFADPVMAGVGAPVASNEGPRSQEAVDALLVRYGPSMAACYWNLPVRF